MAAVDARVGESVSFFLLSSFVCWWKGEVLTGVCSSELWMDAVAVGEQITDGDISSVFTLEWEG